MNDPLYGQLLLQVFLIALNAVFACAEIAIISVNDVRLAQMAASGDKRAIRLAHLTSQPARFLATIQVAITLSGFMGSAFAADSFSEYIVAALIQAGVTIPVATLDTIAVVFITLILSYFTLVFGELVPKRLAMKKAEAIALGLSGTISCVSKIFAPLVWTLTASTNVILRLLRVDPSAEEEQVSEEEIRMMVDVGTQKGVIDAIEKEMIQNVFEFDDLTISEFATHRTDITFLWMEDSPAQWEATLMKSRHSVYPICGESFDRVVGVLTAKDYFRLSDKSRENVMEKAVKPPCFVPESIRADVLFARMKQTHNHFAIVLDEYGGMSGVVTMNDLLEQLVGELEDESALANLPPDIERIDPTTWRIIGSAHLSDVAEQLEVTLPLDEYDTFGGMVFGAYGAIPQDGSHFEIDIATLHIKVTDIKEHRIERALVCMGED